jgi:hypothetical protein
VVAPVTLMKSRRVIIVSSLQDSRVGVPSLQSLHTVGHMA